jgi:hypothetical protein
MDFLCGASRPTTAPAAGFLASPELQIAGPADYVSGYRQLSTLGVGFYPIHSDKSPAVRGKLDQVATVDPIKIRFWAEHSENPNSKSPVVPKFPGSL